jgi:hypothetical protein
MHVSNSPPASAPKLQLLADRYRQLSLETVFYVKEGDGYVRCLPSDPPEPDFPSRLSMISDPAHGGKINAGSLEEGAVGLWAEATGVVSSLQRESTGLSEFVDFQGQTWDVKSPISPPSHQNWTFDASHQVTVVQEELDGGENVLLNLSRCNPTDSAEVVELLKHNIKPWEQQRVVILMREDQSSSEQA